MAPTPAPPPPEDSGQTFASPSPDSGATMNGPTAEGDKVWEKSWSVDEMRKGATNWSLAGDAGLLLHLKEFSQKMVSRTHEIEKQVDGLVHETKVTHVRVNNVFNDFIMLANTQFVENRVYDEDVSQEPKEETKKEEQEKSREQREVELIPKIAEAIGFGLKVIENSFEELDVNVADSDSEEDDDMVGHADKILKVKDPYAHRPLPHLIGSPAFMQEDDVGIIEEFSDEEEIEEISDNGSISDSDKSGHSDSESESSYSETETETDSEVEKPKTRTKSKISKQSKNSDDESSEGNLFGAKDSDEASDMDSEEEPVVKQKPSGGMGGIAAELAAKIGAPPPRPAEDDGDSDEWDEQPKPKPKEHKHKKKRADSSTSQGSHHHRKRTDSERSKGKSTKKAAKEEDPFGGPSIEEDSPFSNKGGLFSGGGGLFDDDDDGGLFGDVPKPKAAKPAPPVDEEEDEEEEEVEKPVERAKTKSGKNIPTGGISIFGGGDDELFTPSPLEDPAPKQKTSAPAKSFGGGLFDDGGDDLFASAPKKAPTKKESTKPPSKPSVDLFGGEDDDEGDLFASMPPVKKAGPPKAVEKKETKKKLPAGAVSAFGSGPNPLAAMIKSQRQGSDEEEEAHWSDSNKSTSSSLSSARHDAKTERSPSVSSNSLFAEEPEEQKSEKKPSKPSPKASSGLFDDEDDDLFSGLPKSKPAAKAASKPNKPSLFVEDDEGDLFGLASAPAPAAAPAKKKPTGGVSLFGGADLFGDSLKKTPEPEEKKLSAPIPEPAPAPAKPKTAVKNSPLSLFDDDNGDDGGGLFGVAPPSKLNPPDDKKKRTRTKSLFEDEDVLFGTSPAAAEDNPTVDLFGANSPLTPSESKAKPFPKEEPKAAPTVRVAGATTKASSTDLFGGDDTTDDLFAAPVKKPEPVKKPTILPLGGATEDESSSDILAAPSEPAATKPKKPVGGVSMFGGMDPFAAKKASPSPKEEKAEVIPKKPMADPLFGGVDDNDDDMFSKPAPKVERTPEPVINNVDTQQSTVSPSKIKAAGLNINPQALLPGAAPPIKEPEQAAVGFDQPASANTLQSLTKGRAKIQQKRRLPSRGRGRPSGASSGQQNGPIDEFDALTTVSVAPPVVNSVVTQPKLPDIMSPPPVVTATPPAGKGRDLFGNDDLFPETSQSDPLFSFGADSSATKKDSTDNGVFKSDSVDKSKDNGPSLGDDDDIFGSGKKSVPQKKDSGDIFGAKSSGLADDDDIFASGPKKSKVPSDLDIFAPKSSQKNETNDIFGGAKTEEKNGEKPTPDLFKSPATDEEDIFASKSAKVTKSKASVLDDDDDIFADSSLNKKKESKPAATATQPSATARDDDEQDIFASKTKQSTTKKEEKKDVFEDDDDLFAKPVKKVAKLKKEKTKDEDLFKDETDIFASLPDSKPKEKKKKKKTDAGSKSLFKGDVDDIFATPKSSSPTSKPKTKKTTTPKKKTTSANDDASIFDENAPSIFDDPLNALQS